MLCEYLMACKKSLRSSSLLCTKQSDTKPIIISQGKTIKNNVRLILKPLKFLD